MSTPIRWGSTGGGWRYLAQRIDGSGTYGAWLDAELPLSEVTITDVLSGPPSMTATITPVHARMKTPDGVPLLNEWGTVIHAENDGAIRGSYILVGSSFDGQSWSLDLMGYTGYLKGMAYTGAGVGTGGEATFIQADPLTIVRHMYADVQGQPGSNLMMVVDGTTKTPIRIGVDPKQAESGSGEQPYRLSWWQTHDLGGEIDKLATETPFDYRERHSWNHDRTQVNHYLDFGYPALGFRRTDLRFILGENIQVMPQPQRDGDDFANHVRLLGAGEGSEMVMAEARRSDGRLRRMAVVDDKSITDKGRAAGSARMELARRAQHTQISEIVVRNTPMAPLGSFGVGDEIRIQATTDWMPVDLWCRVVQITTTPDSPDLMGVSVVRTDALA